jgi:hypothetical protein
LEFAVARRTKQWEQVMLKALDAGANHRLFRGRARLNSAGLVTILGILVFSSPVLAGVTIPIDLANPGAEAGDLSGWENLDVNFSAVHDPAIAAEGEWYFEAPSEPLGYRTHLESED